MTDLIQLHNANLVDSGFQLEPPPNWTHGALCAQVDMDVFYPEKGESTKSAKQICAGCDVREQCLEYALEHIERFGVWGGLSERERRTLLNGRTKRGEKRRPPCGTANAYTYHRRYGEEACQACRDAQNTYTKLRRAERNKTPRNLERTA